jgi:hypothetical protein
MLVQTVLHGTLGHRWQPEHQCCWNLKNQFQQHSCYPHQFQSCSLHPNTSQIGSNSPFWVHVSNKFNSIAQDGDPNVEGIDFLDNVHFTHPFYDSYSVTIDPGKHNLFFRTKLQTMGNIIKGDYDLAMTNVTKSGNHNSSFTATAFCQRARFQCGEEIDNEDVTCSGSEDGEDDPQGVGEQGFAHFTRSLPVIYLRQWLNKKLEHTNFCSKQIPPAALLDSLSSIAVGTMATPAPTAQPTSKKRHRVQRQIIKIS